MPNLQRLLLQFSGVDPDLWQEIDVDQIREDLARLIDRTLRESGSGRWAGARVKANRIELTCRVHDIESAKSLINEALAGHPLFPYLKFQ